MTDTTIEEKLQKLQDDLAVEQAAKRKLQAKADRLEARGRAQALREPPPTPTPIPDPEPAPAPVSVDEATILKEAMARGLVQEDLDALPTLEFETQAELRLTLDNYEMKKRLTQLEQSKPAGEPPSQLPIDTGGPTVLGEAAQFQAELDAQYSAAKQLGGTGKHQDARWLILRAAHQDPRRVIRHRQ